MKYVFYCLAIIAMSGCVTRKSVTIPVASTVKVQQNLAVLGKQLSDGVQMSDEVAKKFKVIQDASDVIGAYLSVQDNKAIKLPSKP
jgi:hypothetical protein